MKPLLVLLLVCFFITGCAWVKPPVDGDFHRVDFQYGSTPESSDMMSRGTQKGFNMPAFRGR